MPPRARFALPVLFAALSLTGSRAVAAPAPPANPDVSENNGFLNFSDSSAGTAQALTITAARDGARRVIRFADTGPPDLRASGGCRRVSAGLVACPEPEQGRIQLVLKGLDDAVRVIKGVRLRIEALGGDGNDHLAGGSSDDDLKGEAGDDTLDGGEGADDFRGGAGTDTVDFSSRGPASVVRVTLGDEEVDGDLSDVLDGLIKQTEIKALRVSASQISLGGEPAAPPAPRVGDNVHADVERVIGGAGGDDLVGNGLANELVGGPGPDILEGKAGPDRLDGGEGDDTLVSRDGEVDVLACGNGADRVVADPQDNLAADCERTDNGAAPGEAPGGAVAGTPPEAAIVTRVVQVSRSGVARLRIRCVYRAERCRGPVRLVSAVAAQARVGRRVLRVRAGQTLAARNVDIPWGTSQGFTLQVGSAARQVIARRARGLRGRATATLTDSAAGTRVPARLSRAVGVVRAPARARR